MTRYRVATNHRPCAGWNDEGELITARQAPRLTDIVPAALASLTSVDPARLVTDDPAAMPSPLLDPSGVLQFPEATKVCLVVLDGLGYHMLTARQGHAPALRELCLKRPDTPGQPRYVRTCIPSSTACAIPAFTTGANPGTTRMTGYEAWSPQQNTVINLLQFRDRRRRVHSADGYYQRPTVFDVLNEAGYPAYAYGPKKFEGSGMSHISLHGARFERIKRFEQSCEKAIAHLNGGATLSYVYADAIDHAGHQYGWGSYEWLQQLEDIDSALAKLCDGLPQGTLVVVTADHGMVNVDFDYQTDIANYPRLTDNVDAIAGEPRAVHIHTHEVDRVVDEWLDHFDDQILIVTAEDARDFYGEPVTGTLPDITVFSRGAGTIVDSRLHSPAARAMKGVHGSLTPGEMDIPLGVYVA